MNEAHDPSQSSCLSSFLSTLLSYTSRCFQWLLSSYILQQDFQLLYAQGTIRSYCHAAGGISCSALLPSPASVSLLKCYISHERTYWTTLCEVSPLSRIWSCSSTFIHSQALLLPFDLHFGLPQSRKTDMCQCPFSYLSCAKGTPPYLSVSYNSD